MKDFSIRDWILAIVVAAFAGGTAAYLMKPDKADDAACSCDNEAVIRKLDKAKERQLSLRRAVDAIWALDKKIAEKHGVGSVGSFGDYPAPVTEDDEEE